MVVHTQAQQNTALARASAVALAASGDAEAFSRLIMEHEGMLYRVCRTILQSEADCADAVQETVITAWRSLGQLKNADSFPAWVARICINRCYRQLRRSKRTEAETAFAGREPGHDARLDVSSAVAALPESLRLVVVFYYFEDWKVEQIAWATGLLRGTVKSRLHRARQLLAEQLRDYKEGFRDDAR